MTTQNNNHNFDKLIRKDQPTIFHLRTQHIPLNSHLNRIGATAEKACPLFNHKEETVEHHLFYLTKLKDLIEIFLPSQPDTQNTLFGTAEKHMSFPLYVTELKGKRPRAAGSLRRRNVWFAWEGWSGKNVRKCEKGRRSVENTPKMCDILFVIMLWRYTSFPDYHFEEKFAVLVFDNIGVSRCAAVVLAVLMHHHKWTLAVRTRIRMKEATFWTILVHFHLNDIQNM